MKEAGLCHPCPPEVSLLLFYLLSKDPDTLSQTVTHSSSVCAEAMCSKHFTDTGAAGASQEPTVFIKR